VRSKLSVQDAAAIGRGLPSCLTFLFLCSGLCVPAYANQPEQAVGLVLSAGGSKLQRQNVETPLAARAGDLLFPGDILRTESTGAAFLFCPAMRLETLGPSGEVRLDSKEPNVKAGKLTPQPAQSCSLPKALRVEVASQQHYGVTMTRGGPDSAETPPTPRDKLSPEVVAELAPFDRVLAASPKDPPALLGVAEVFDNRNLTANALDAYLKVREQWPDAVWVKSKIFDLQQSLAISAATASAAAASSGQTFALLIGVSKFKNPEISLQFAAADAVDFEKLVASPRGGALPPDNIALLTDEKATLAAVRLGFQDFLKRRAGKNDTVIILIASHGTVEIPGSKSAFILTYDSDPQDLGSTALPMAELKSLFDEQLAKVGRMVLFVDVCKASTIGTIKGTGVNSDVQHLQDADGQLLGLMASRTRELSFEGPQFGNGHGAFSYSVIKGLAGAADENGDDVVDGNELIRYVVNSVPKATGDKQHPTDISNSDVSNVRLSDLKKPGFTITRAIPAQNAAAPVLLAAATPQAAQSQAPGDLGRFEAAIGAGRLLPEQPDDAMDALQRLRNEVTPERYAEATNELRVALENKAQEVLLQYLAGDERPQARQAFDDGTRYMAAARTLTGESLLLEAREDFFRGRTLLFDKKFANATPLLEDAIRMDPGAAYGYNALGIAYLEQGRFDEALPAFRDAARHAQHWAYPLHNAALTYVELGDYASAIRSYQQAMRLTPEYAYLPYNLGLVYQRINRNKEAEAAYRKAMMLAPNTPEPHNALGTLLAAEGKRMEAEQSYRRALTLNPNLLPARHNLALLLSHEKGRDREAIDLWRQNLQQSPDYIPSHISLAGFLAERDDNAGAIQEYRTIVTLKPDYIAARLALGKLLARTGDPEGALRELRAAIESNSQNPELFEEIGDVEAAGAHAAEARAAYRQALTLAPDAATRKRIGNKLKGR
jgi:tetratricopeptide (TPR) repeat protein